MFKCEENEKIGKYLAGLIDAKYKSGREFCKDYLKLEKIEPTKEEIRKKSNRLSQIMNGKKSIQTYDLPIFSELLLVSCEEILSCGETIVPIAKHMTNYMIAYSHDREVWEKYMNRDDGRFLNMDEYAKSVLDYALEFKNYEFIRYLLDEKHIWFVDNSKCSAWGLGIGFGAGTDVKSGPLDWEMKSSLLWKIQSEDRLRTETIVLAIQNQDYDALDELKAREIPTFYQTSIVGPSDVILTQYCNNRLIDAIAHSNKKVIDYFTCNFSVTYKEQQNEYMFPFLNEVMDILIEEKNPLLELALDRTIAHNEKTYKMLKTYMEQDYQWLCVGKADWDIEIMKGQYIAWVNQSLNYDQKKRMVFFYYTTGTGHKDLQYHGLATDLFYVTKRSKSDVINKRIDQLNELYKQITELKFEVET